MLIYVCLFANFGFSINNIKWILDANFRFKKKTLVLWVDSID
jgi:hypothetical protein